MRNVFRGDRLAKLLEETGISQSELARRVGVSQATIWKLVREPSQGSKHLHKIARELNTSSEFLSGESDDPSVATLQDHHLPFGHAPRDVSTDTVQLQQFDVSYGLGGAFIHDAPAASQMRTFSRAWVRQFTDSPFDKAIV